MILKKNPCLGKIWLFSHGLKCSQPIRFQYSLITNMSGRNQSILQIFCMDIVIKNRQHLRLPILVGCYQLYLSSNPKAGLFDHQYLWKESVNILDFLLGDNHQRKEASKTTTFGQVWLVVLLSNQIPGFFGHQYLQKKSSNFFLDFLHVDSHQVKVKVAFGTTSFGWVLWPVLPLANMIAGFLDHQNLSKESSDILAFLHGVSHQGKVVSETTTFGQVCQLCFPRPVNLQDSLIINTYGK